MENLPVFKVSFLAIKSMLSAFKIKSVYVILLPLFLMNSLYAAMFDINKSVGVFARPWLVEFMPIFSNESTVLTCFLSVLFIIFWFNVLVAVRWHRYVLLGEDVSVKRDGLGKVGRRFFWQMIKLTFLGGVLGVLAGALITFLMASMGKFILPGYEGVSVLKSTVNLFLAISMLIIPLLIFVFIVRVTLGASFSFPATALGIKLGLFKAYRFAGVCVDRFFLSTVIVVLLTYLPYLILSFLLSVFSLGASGLEIFLSPFLALATVSLLSIFFMHYIVPQLNVDDLDFIPGFSFDVKQAQSSIEKELSPSSEKDFEEDVVRKDDV